MSGTPANPIPSGLFFVVFFIVIVGVCQLVAWQFGVELNTGIALAAFVASGCLVALHFAKTKKRTPTNWEARQMALSSVLIFSMFQIAVVFVLLHMEGGDQIQYSLETLPPLLIASVLFVTTFAFYIYLILVYYWGARALKAWFERPWPEKKPKPKKEKKEKKKEQPAAEKKEEDKAEEPVEEENSEDDEKEDEKAEK